jgi:3-oxoacyl-[acyl-carrier-protein] synthase-3
MKINNTGIAGVGSYLPKKRLTNADLEKMVDTSDEWIIARTGIKERRIIEDDSIMTSDLAAEASIRALDDAKMKPEELDLIIVATITPDMFTPSVSCIVQNKIGATKAAALDLNAACSGFTYGMTIADQFIKSGYYKNILLVGADCLSKIVNWKDRNTCVLFGDGAGAVILKPVSSGEGILSTDIGADGSLGDKLTAAAFLNSEIESEKRNGGPLKTLWMDGSEVFKFAVKAMAKSTETVLNKIDKTIGDVDMIVPHQANSRIIDGAAKRLRISKDEIFTNLDKYGNMSAASIPVALDEAVKQGVIKSGDLIILVGFGGGLTWGAAAIKWS